MTRVLVATGRELLIVEAERGTVARGAGLDGRPTCLAADPHAHGRAWCGTDRSGVFRSDDGGATWSPAGLAGERVMAIALGPAEPGVVWVGTEPSAVWRWVDRDGQGAEGGAEGGAGDRVGDGARRWARTSGLEALPSSPDWAFPPRPDTHHVRWIACHPREPGRLWVAIEAGALVSTGDGGRSWRDRVPGGPYDTHELAIHPSAPEVLRVAAGDGYYESRDGGATWASPDAGLEVGYLRSVAVDPGDPDTVVVSAASGPRSTYVAGHADGRLYRRQGGGAWSRVVAGWPDPPATIAPLLAAGRSAGELWAGDERGVHRSADGGRTWSMVAEFDPAPGNLRGLAVAAAGDSAGPGLDA